jgi:hypothetical protein
MVKVEMSGMILYQWMSYCYNLQQKRTRESWVLYYIWNDQVEEEEENTLVLAAVWSSTYVVEDDETDGANGEVVEEIDVNESGLLTYCDVEWWGELSKTPEDQFVGEKLGNEDKIIALTVDDDGSEDVVVVVVVTDAAVWVRVAWSCTSVWMRLLESIALCDVLLSFEPHFAVASAILYVME